jgi:uncharacterized protein with HEPN domain
MRSEQTDIALRDILHHADLATSFTEDFDRDSFKSDMRTVYAVTVALRSYPKHRDACRIS